MSAIAFPGNFAPDTQPDPAAKSDGTQPIITSLRCLRGVVYTIIKLLLKYCLLACWSLILG
jgi:hypothetical protein